MSDTKEYIVRTKGKPKFVGSVFRYSEGQVVSFKTSVVESTPWIKAAIAKGNLVEVGTEKKEARVESTPTPSKAPAKKSTRSSRKKKAEPAPEEPTPEPTVEEALEQVETPKEEVKEEEPKAEESEPKSE